MIKFETAAVQSTFLDPQNDYEARSITIEHRQDPLTGSYSRIADYIGPLEEQEISQAVVDGVIPIFVPPLVDQITPRYPEAIDADGRLKRGRSVLFPNLNPYDEYSPVVAIGDEPLVKPGELATEDVGDALCLMRDFFSRLPEGRQIGLIGWNYLPQSSSSIPHPHMQAAATYRVPARPAAEYASEAAHREQHGTSFWDDLIAAESDGPRWLGGNDGWTRMVAFAPRSAIPESLIVSKDIDHLQAATDEDLSVLAGKLVALATAHHRIGYSSFNIVLHPTAAVSGSRLRVRYIPRAYLVPKLTSSDHMWLHVGSEEGLCMISPERFATQLGQRLQSM